MKKVIIIGPSIERTRGGIATVIQGLIDSDAKRHGYYFEHLISHVEGSLFEKLFFFFKCLFKLFITRKIALAHIHTACDASFYRKAIYAFCCRIKGIPFIMHIHGSDFDTFYSDSNSMIKAIINRTLKNSSRVIVLSDYWKVFFNNKMPLVDIYVLHNAVNNETFRSCCTIPQNIEAFLFLGRLGERKGIYDLIKAIDVLVNKNGLQNLKFYFAGDGEIDQVKEMIDKLNLNKNIDVLGWVTTEMKAKVFLKADTVILPSYNEGLPMALLEAMAAGKVILSTRVGGIPDLVTEGENGFLIKSGDIDALVLMIKYIMQHPDQMKIISRNNVEKIGKEFNSVKINKQLFELYDQILH